MKYIDILKQYDNAIVSESEKLNKIYNKLINESEEQTTDKKYEEVVEKCNEGESCEDGECNEKCNEEKCPDCGKEVEDCDCEKKECVKEEENEDEKRTMTEFSEDEDEDKKKKERRKSEKLVSREEFFGTDDEGSEEKTEDNAEASEEVSDEETEDKSEEEMEEKTDEAEEEVNTDTAAISAKELFAEATPEEIEAGAVDGTEENKVKEDALEDVSEGCEKNEKIEEEQNIKTAKDWLGEGEEKKEDEKPVETKEEETKDDAENVDEPEEEETEEEVDQEEEELKESIQAIRAFTKANKKIFESLGC